MNALTAAHILGQQRLRQAVERIIATIWSALPGYDREDVDGWLASSVPLVLAAQRQSVALTEGFLSRSIGRPPIGVIPDDLIGAAVRNGTDPDVVYQRPFITLWSDLKQGKRFEPALNDALARAQNTAATDVQLSMRETLRAVGEADTTILGYARVPDAGACPFCRLVSGQRYRTDQLMPIHPHCGCGVDVITEANRGDFSGKRENDLSVPGAAVHEHGELGPVLLDPGHAFTSAAAIAA